MHIYTSNSLIYWFVSDLLCKADDDVKTGLCRTWSERLISDFVFSLVSQMVNLPRFETHFKLLLGLFYSNKIGLIAMSNQSRTNGPINAHLTIAQV